MNVPRGDSEPEYRDYEEWWQTSISDISPGSIRLRGYEIEDLIRNTSFVETIWLLTRGDLPDPWSVRLLEAALVASVDHGPQAPSIASARMAATCGVGINSAMANGINVLGDIHGGAGQQCMEMYARVALARASGKSLRQAAESEMADWTESQSFVPGFGHRIHSIDPRVSPLVALVKEAAEAGAVSGRCVEISDALRAAIDARAKKPVPMNIDGVTAVVYYELGFEPIMARGLFALSRSVGILAHAYEETRNGSRLKGPMPSGVQPRYIGFPIRKTHR